MDRASSLIYPGSRTLAGWWRQLAPLQPNSITIGYVFLHRIEAPVNLLMEEPIDPLADLVLQALALQPNAIVRLADLQARLRLPTPIVQRVLAGMREKGLLAQSTADTWHPTELGKYALDRRTYPVHSQGRRVFSFVERLDPAGQRQSPPAFVPMAECVGTAWPVDAAHRFEIDNLQAAIAQPLEWKQTAGFPLEVESLASAPTPDSWQHVIVDRPERVMLALVQTSQEIQGLAIKVDGWTLFERTPVLRIAPSTWPELTQAPPMQVWQDAWRGWCKQRQLPTNEVEICSLSYRPPRLEVQAPPRLVQRLQAAKSDLFKGEAWLLVGEGYLRTALQLTIRQNS
jgi:hypothetical protein